MNWQYMQEGEIRGPLSSEAFAELWPKLPPETKIYRDDWNTWRKLAELRPSELPAKKEELAALRDESRSHPAEFWRRALALLIDYFLMRWLASFLSGGLPSWQHEDYSGPGAFFQSYHFYSFSDASGGWPWSYFGWQFALTLPYEALLTWRYGWTLGKFLFGIRVSWAGRPPSLWQALLRVLVKKLNIFILMLGYLMPLWDRDEMALHDHLCKTRVYLR